MSKYETVRVTWYDPHSIDEWKIIKDIDYSVTFIESFGYEIHKDDKVTVLALNYDEDQKSVSCTMIIPDVCIKDYEYIDVE